jgi:hypothetical protein
MGGVSLPDRNAEVSYLADTVRVSLLTPEDQLSQDTAA